MSGTAVAYADANAAVAVEQGAAPAGTATGEEPEFVRVRRAIFERVPSFSPYTRIVHAWSRQGSWLLRSTEASWPPPWPKLTASSLVAGDQQAQFSQAIGAALAEGFEIVCPEAEPALRRGQALLRVEGDDRSGQDLQRCVLFEEDLDTGRFSPELEALSSLAPPVESVDRWTHPFWLLDESGVLRVELHGTADVRIDTVELGRVNGVLTLRLPVGMRELTLRAAKGDVIRRERVVLRRDQVTVLRISLEDEGMEQVPAWSQPPR